MNSMSSRILMMMLVGLGFLCMGHRMPAEAAPTSLPNIVFIPADDQGWNALSIPADPANPGSGSTYYQTPRLAQLAREGMRFSQAYSPAPTCSPDSKAVE